jgi:hypothetical protein
LQPAKPVKESSSDKIIKLDIPSSLLLITLLLRLLKTHFVSVSDASSLSCAFAIENEKQKRQMSRIKFFMQITNDNITNLCYFLINASLFSQ